MKYKQIDTIGRKNMKFSNNSMNDLMILNFILNKFYETYVVQEFHELTFE